MNLTEVNLTDLTPPQQSQYQTQIDDEYFEFWRDYWRLEATRMYKIFYLIKRKVEEFNA